MSGFVSADTEARREARAEQGFAEWVSTLLKATAAGCRTEDV